MNYHEEMTTRLFTACLLLAAATMAQTPATPKARVLVYQRFPLKLLRTNPLFVDGVQVASLGHHKWSYFVVIVTPGEHSFRAKRKTDQIIIDTVAGHDYFLELQADFASIRFVRQTAEEGAEAVGQIVSGKLPPIDPSDVMDHKQVSLDFLPANGDSK